MSSKPLTDNEVLAEVRSLVSQNKVGWTTHSEVRMAERGFDKGQVKECLAKGWFTEAPTTPNTFGDVQYQFRMTSTIDGELLSVAASLHPTKKVVVITVLSE